MPSSSTKEVQSSAESRETLAGVMGPFADLHCHPTFFSFNRLRHGKAEQSGEGFDPWNVPASDIAARDAGRRATHYAQCDFPAMSRNRVRLVFASLTPIERPFFISTDPAPFGRELLRWFTGQAPADATVKLLQGDRQGAAQSAARILRNRGPLRKAIQKIFLGFPKARIDFLMSEGFDYWDELRRELSFLRNGADRDVDLGNGEQGHYTIVRNRQELDETLAADEDRLAVILTIEGGHVFSLGPDDEPVSEELIFSRIDELRRWPEPVLFLTLAHHFDNGMLGHARSLIDAGSLLIDQVSRLNEGLEPKNDLGYRVIRHLLARDEDLQPTGEQPIHIDCKHFSARSRKEYYARVIDPLLERGEQIPVIFSHVGYSGVRTLDELIDAEGHERDRWVSAGFNAWGINVCDEDVHRVLQTGGLIGLCLDRRIAGLAPGHEAPPEHHGRILLRQIFGIVDAVLSDDRIAPEDAERIWECITIGSDYDGAIQPLARYATVGQFPQLARDLAEGLRKWQNTRGIARQGVDRLMDQFLWRNALRFAQRHLPGK